MLAIKTLALALLMTPGGPTNQQLEKGVLAVRGHFKHVDQALATRLVREAREVLSRPGNRWMPIEQLLGLAINESDLRSGLRMGLDCGITQNRVDQFPSIAKGWRARVKLCKAIAKSSKMSFEFALLEMNKIRRKWCHRFAKRPDRFMRCILQVYNQGPRARYKTRCKRYEWTTRRSQRKCKSDLRYYLRNYCFATGVWLGRKSRKSCRYAYAKWQIKSLYRMRKGDRYARSILVQTRATGEVQRRGKARRKGDVGADPARRGSEGARRGAGLVPRLRNTAKDRLRRTAHRSAGEG